MKKIICLFVLLAFIPSVQADKKKKQQQQQQSSGGGGHPQAPGGGNHGSGGFRMPGGSHGAQPSHAPGTSRGGQSGALKNRALSNSSSAAHKAPGARSNNPLMRHGGQAHANTGKTNPLTQKNHQLQSNANGGKNNPLNRKGGQAGLSARNQPGPNNRNFNRNRAAQQTRSLNGRRGLHGVARGSRANYRVRPYRDAFHNYRAVRHDRGWYTTHYDRVVVVGGGYYYWDAGYWYPAWGYDPAFSFYVYDGPIYSYDNLPPDQVIVNVQTELQDEGYYTGEIDGQLGPQTRDALGAYQSDHDLEVTSAVDEPTVEALGLAEADGSQA